MTAPATGSTPGDKPAKKPTNYKAAWAETRRLMWQHRGSLAIGLVLMLVNRLSGLVLPGSVKWIVDEVLTKGRLELLTPIAIAAGAATLLQASSSFALSQVISVAAQRAITELRRRVQARVLRLPVSFFDSTQSGILINRVMNDAEGIRNLIGTGIIQLVGGMLTAALALGYLFYLNWFLTVATLVFLAVFGGIMAYAFVKLRPIFRERSKIQAEVSGRLGQAMGGARVVKVYTAEKREEVVFTKGAHRLFRNIASTITGTSAVGALATVIIGAVGVLILVVGGRSVAAGEMTLGDLISYVFFVGLVSFPVVQMANIGTQITEAFAGLDRIREIFETPTEDEDDRQRDVLAHANGDVVFDKVWFEYRPGIPVLKDITFTAKAGTTTALVGSSGSGKSTLISLILAFNRPLTGRITIGGQDLTTLRLRDYRGTLGVVLQDNFLFDGTVAENIAFSRPGATREEIIAAARVANCDEFVSQFPDGYETIVGERGVKLSGGQRQRVAIARAILADPQVLILDEATSSLDSESERTIREALKKLRAGRTTFVIAHRLSTIRSADQILVLEQGEIVERGSHRELMALGGRYKVLHDTQHAVEQDLFVNPGEEVVPLDANG
ncbi:ABC transporter ATP-binding protein [Pseudogemmatithrix spongiicola]|uniref:ABC transporter ATP-binding protein n=1 Tax=Pseudogemmatithrix spongiicola TaxID=3062599 RepID=A0AA49JWY5_9BACT|nr:ABC transporter ATP-binding protein [Gemmatimonadaceae bacterium 'strain 138']WKW16034.1 ABC transporter ATP-binding protein [Gemmatimonadaceae bacterium 'strain 318']